MRREGDLTKVAIQGLGEVPTTIEIVLKKEKPDVTYIVTSDYQLKLVAPHAGYNVSNKEVVERAAKKVKAKVKFKKCDPFDPESVTEAIRQILEEIDPKKDEVIVNYTGGSSLVRLLLGATGVVLPTVMKAKVLYAIKYPEGTEITADHTGVLREIFPEDLQVLFSLKKGKGSSSKPKL